ncbi:MAG: archaeal proteasome endopeptidase complex subunit beta [Methanobacterium sp.]|nr:archaeal proteasome endopeptidase complex subunit beta [Methanobacterium sp.]
MNDKDRLKGTTTVGVTCKDGIVFATERRASMGNLIAHKVADKIFKIDDHIGATIAGSVSDAQKLMGYISAEVALYRLRNGTPMSVEAAANMTSNILHASRFYPYYVQTLLGGVDEKGPALFSLDPSGGVIKDLMISTGSGSPVAYGVLEDRYNQEMDIEEGTSVVIRAIKAAMERDTYSGNGIRVATITKEEGFKILPDDEVAKKIEELN